MTEDLKPENGESTYDYLERILDPALKKKILEIEIKPGLDAAIQEGNRLAAADMGDYIEAGHLLPTGDITKLFKKVILLTCLANCGFDIQAEQAKVRHKLEKKYGISVEFFAKVPPRAKRMDDFLIPILPRSVKERLEEILDIHKNNAVQNEDYEKAAYYRDLIKEGKLPPSGKPANALRRMTGLVAAEKSGFNIAEDMMETTSVLYKAGLDEKEVGTI